MPRIICQFLLIGILLTACLPGNVAPIPTSTLSPTLTPIPPTATPVPTKSPIPTETAEQRSERLAQVVNWNPNDETAWGIPSGLSAEDTAFLQEMIAIDADPNTKTHEQKVAYDGFMADMRRTFLSSLPGGDKAALEQMINEEIMTLMYDWCAENKVAFMPTHVELWRWNDSLADGILNKDVQYASIVAEDGTLLAGTRYNGLWMDRSNDEAFTYPNSWDKVRFANSMFGEEKEWVGNLWNDTHMAVLGNVLRLPYGVGYDATIIGRSGTMYHLPTVVGLVGQDGVTAYTFKDTHTNEAVVSEKVVWQSELFTRLKTGNDQFRPLTLEDLFNGINHRIVWTPSNEHDANRFIYGIFFDKKTGLYVLGSTDVEDRRGGQTSLEITTYVEP